MFNFKQNSGGDLLLFWNLILRQVGNSTKCDTFKVSFSHILDPSQIQFFELGPKNSSQ